MITAVIRALAEDAEARRGMAAAVATRAGRRVARRRRRRVAALAGATAAMLAAVVWSADALWTHEPTGVWHDDSLPAEALDPTEVLGPAVISADQLLEDVAPRSRVGDAHPDRQPALVCEDEPHDGELSRCGAVWAGGAPLIRLDPDATTITVIRAGTTARVEVRWAVQNVSPSMLLLDQADALVAMLTDPGAVGHAGKPRDGTLGGLSLWLDDSDRLARNVGATSRAQIAPGSRLVGRAWMVATAPEPGRSGGALWRIASGAESGTLTVQLGVASDRRDPSRALLLEASIPVAEIREAVTADTLAATFRPRAKDEPPPGDAQAALLCQVPEPLRVSAFQTYEVPVEARTVACEPGWVDGPVLVDDGSLTASAATAGARPRWGVINALPASLVVSYGHLQVEAHPEGPGGGAAGMAVRHDAVATQTNAWAEDGRRGGWLTNVSYQLMVEPGEAVLGFGRLPTLPDGSDRIDDDVIARALDGHGAVYAVVAVPFADDASAVLLLETPLSTAPPP